jgi:competence ComEA-like helix-hairpin-helix protein
VHSTPDARFALVCLLALAASVCLARLGETHFRAARAAPGHEAADQTDAGRPLREGAAKGLRPREAGVASRSAGAIALSRSPVTHAGKVAVTGPRTEGDALRDGHTIDLNRASSLELELLPGVGPRLALEIVRERERIGSFADLRDLRGVRGIGEKTLAKMAPWLHVTTPDGPPGRGAAASLSGEPASSGEGGVRAADQPAPSKERTIRPSLGSERLEHAADTQRHVRAAEALAGSREQQRGAHVEPDDPAAREQVVESEHEVSAQPHR